MYVCMYILCTPRSWSWDWDWWIAVFVREREWGPLSGEQEGSTKRAGERKGEEGVANRGDGNLRL